MLVGSRRSGTPFRAVAWLTVAVVAASASVAVMYRRNLVVARERVRGHSQVLPSPFGDIRARVLAHIGEYAGYVARRPSR